MAMSPLMWEWVSFAFRWVHVITAIAWIGSSFYFIALDLGLRRALNAPRGVGGEAWQVHGGGFYHIQKYMVAPEGMPEDLTWFKWEAYSTWISGFALLCVVYLAGADLHLIDTAVLDLARWQAVIIALVVLAAGWIVYDLACRSPLGRHEALLAVLVFGYFVAVCLILTHVFTGRGAFVLTGALMASAMTGNVFFVIIPNQKKVVASLLAGRDPDPELGREAKLRSLHNNYLTLPVLFLMLSTHNPLAFATEFNWVIAALVMVIGVVVRHFFNTMHAHGGYSWWTWGVAALCGIAIAWLSSFPAPAPAATKQTAAPRSSVAAAIAAPQFTAVRDIVQIRCMVCHSDPPAWGDLATPPKGVRLDSDENIALHATDIDLQAVRSRSMPPGNLSGLTDAERTQIAAWVRAIGVD
jgi:uncharacterized membrane protein